MNFTAIAVHCKESDVRYVRALIIGPPETPYEFGFFEFNLRFSKDYPTRPPVVSAITTNNGNTRFNPNIYSCGKVCLSILGTWRGEAGEQWSSAQSLESVLISIQSLMSSNPYENEPGYEGSKATERMPAVYIEKKIQHETIRISVIQSLEEILRLPPLSPPPTTGRQKSGLTWKLPTLGNPPASALEYDAEADYRSQSMELEPAHYPFADLCKRRFLWYYDSYLATVDKASQKVQDGQEFQVAEFEFVPNTMRGQFHYPMLRKRLERLKGAVDDEVRLWAEEGLEMVQAEKAVAHNLRRQFEQTREFYGTSHSGTSLNLTLGNENPFTWHLTLFGRPMTQLDGGIFNVSLAFSPRFPEEQPRVKFLTPLFHHRIAKDGTMCYFPEHAEEPKSHVAAIIKALEEEQPRYDPRTLVNAEAAELFWGGEDGRKIYNRRLRRAVQRSCEFE
ncbi:hypothetical protein LTR50_004184 [Elasticomyces elasticus]|nr:hypothetical protein LTR50_004184 [Elasticomyces elasticus]